MPLSDGPELVLALAAAVGTDLEHVIMKIDLVLQRIRYQAHSIRLASLIKELPAYRAKLIFDTDDKYIETHMTQGNELRKATGRNDALAILAIGEIKKIRKEIGATNGKAPGRHPYILRSLKHPKQVRTLRPIYNAALYPI